MKNKKDERFPAILSALCTDKIAGKIPFRVISRVSRAIFFFFLLVLGTSGVFAQGPAWWFSRGAVDTNLQANDYSPITLGQLKWMATNAFDEMNAYFGAGSNVTAVVSAFSNTNNYYPANIGQVKYVAQPFYDRLYELDLTNTFPANMPGHYPWDGRPETNDYAMVNIGQAKYVFSFDSAKDSDQDGMPDWWEATYGFNPYENDGTLDTDGDGLTNLQEYQYGTNPNNPDTDGDGMPDGWEVAHGLNPLVNDAALDPDNDGLTTLQEYQNGTDPHNPDTDGDGFGDGWEIAQGLNPLNPGDGHQSGTNSTDTARQMIIRHNQLYYGATLTFTNTPGSDADLIDLRDALNSLSGKFYKVE